MPTPSDDTAPPIANADYPQTPSSIYTTCPVDDIRATRSLTREEIEAMIAQHEHESRYEAEADRPRQNEEKSEDMTVITPVTNSIPVVRTVQELRSHERAQTARQQDDGTDEGEHVEALEVTKASSQPVQSSESASDCDARPAASLQSVDAALSGPPPQYLHFRELDKDRFARLTTSFLRPGSKFVGTQTSDRQCYEVQVEIKDVDLAESFLCGYLRIQGLTDDHPTLTTFFEGEIIGPKYKFKTMHPTWGSNEKIDMTHWACFNEWRDLAKTHRSPNFTAPDYLQREHLYMRWKEYFLVPDHRVKTITGASFEGFYYISFNQCSGTVEGVYFHAKSEKWQQLKLKHVDDRGCMPAIEFR